MGRYSRARQIAQLDPVADRTLIVRKMVQFEFPWDMQRSLELALFRTFAVPSIGRLLDRTREFGDATQKRYDDTLLLLYHVWLDDTADERRVATEHLNFIHGHYSISNDDFRYTLSTFVVVPVRWLQRYGWRPLSYVEVTAWTNVMRDMGAQMGIHGMPETYEGFAALLDDYEATRFGYDPANERVARATLDMMVGWYPRLIRPVVRAFVPALLEKHVLTAVGLPVAGRRRQRIADWGVRTRARLVRLLPPRRDSNPYEPKIPTYSEEPALRDLGPAALLRRRDMRAAKDAAAS
jgi:hypothetical protein